MLKIAQNREKKGQNVTNKNTKTNIFATISVKNQGGPPTLSPKIQGDPPPLKSLSPPKSTYRVCRKS
jgi:hypothetical protein